MNKLEIGWLQIACDLNVSHEYHQYYQMSQLNLKAIIFLCVSAGVKTYKNKQKHT